MNQMVDEEEPDPLPEPVNVCVDNLTEDVWPFVAALDNEKARKAEIEENAALTDRNYLDCVAEFGENLIFVAPKQLETEFVDYISDLFKLTKPIACVSPKQHRGVISKEILDDPGLQTLLPKRLRLISYCSSPELYILVDRLRRQGYVVETPEMPKDMAVWEQTVAVFGTKGGLRRVLAKRPELYMSMPDGAVYERFEEALPAAVQKAEQEGAVVIKTNKGHAGMGVALLGAKWVAEHRAHLKEDIRTHLVGSNGYWSKFPVVVESFLQPDKRVGGGLPDVECRVSETGAEVLYTCGMRAVNGVFAGVEFGKDAIQDPRLEIIGETLGAIYYERGYRGYFDVDCIAVSDGTIYVGESNVRRTGGTWAYHVAKTLLGNAFLADWYTATQLAPLPNSPISFSELLKTIEPLMFSPQTKEGVVVNSSQLLHQGKLGYMVMGKSKARAYELEAEMWERLR